MDGNALGHVCLSVCLSRLCSNFESHNPESLFLVCRYILRISRSNSCIKVIGSRSRSQEQKVILNTRVGDGPSLIGRQSCFCLHCVSKNDTDVAHYNFNVYQEIVVILGRDVAERVCYQTVICYPTSPN